MAAFLYEPDVMLAPFIQLDAISKNYGAVKALSNVSLTVNTGEILGLIGENGAGKSTLMKVLGGVIAPTSGRISVGGAVTQALTVRQSIDHGIAFVHQELNLFDNLDVASNLFFGREPRRGGWLGFIDRAELRRRSRPLLEQLGCQFTPDTLVAELPLAQRQMIEIAKALATDARLIIMDEPTSSLTATETIRLLDVVAALKTGGVSVIFITHRMSEIEICADRVVALRDGQTVGELAREDISRNRMVRLMIGRDLASIYNPPAREPGPPLLKVEGVATARHPKGNINLALQRGEILGLGGLIGAGRTEFARILFGIDRPNRGRIEFDGLPYGPQNVGQAVKSGVYLVPEDRKATGLILDLSISENISLASLSDYAKGGFINFAKEKDTAERQRGALRIKSQSVAANAGSLSGGNQQKIILAKWLSMQPKLMILDEPTRGIDVGSKSEIYAIMRRLADEGIGILMISSDMEELLGISDRVAIMHEGSISGTLSRAELSEESVMHLAVGSHN